MKHKLTAAEVKALYELMEQIADMPAPSTPQNRLLKLLLFRIYKKLLNKTVQQRSHFTLTFSQEEALTFYLFFQHAPIPIQTFVGTLLHRMLAEIHQKIIV